MAAPGGHGLVGPFPPGVTGDPQREDYDRLRRRALRSLPYGLYVVGSRHADRRNAMTLNWVTQVSFEPKLVAIQSHNSRDVPNSFFAPGKTEHIIYSSKQ